MKLHESYQRPHRKVAGLGATLMALMAVVVGLGVLSLTSIQHEFGQFAERDFPAFSHLLHIDRDLFRAEGAIERAFLTEDVDERSEAVAEWELQVERTADRWEEYLRFAYQSPEELELQRFYNEHRALWLDATQRLADFAIAGRTRSDPEVAAARMEAHGEFGRIRTTVHALEEEFYEPLVERGTDVDQFDARLLLLALLAGGLVTGGLASFAAVRTTKRQYLKLRQREMNKRFRSLVESTHDVITVVADIDTLTVMSSGLGALDYLSSTSAPNTVQQLLGDSEYQIWLAADRRILTNHGVCSIEFESVRADGTCVHIEAQGGPMADDPTERVWVWRDISARKELELQLSHQAFHDSLTGVANRTLLHDRVSHALSVATQSNKPVTVLFCDLDDFKSVNDSLGHARGDELLKIITNRICRCVRDCDTVARLGGDEFAILLEDATTEMASALAERILSVVGYEVDLAEQKVFPSISVGIATAIVGTTTEELLRSADLAMYEAKRAGKGRAEVYEARMHEITSEFLELQAELRLALSEGQLSLHYQPTVDLADQRVDGVEALIRWQHPTRGNIPPDQFINVAEATGMIIAIGRWVLAEACRAAVALQEQQGRPLLMAVNLSPQQLRDPTIVSTVKAVLEESGLAPEHLVLEVTEGCLLDDASAVARLDELSALGTLIAVDDFGTGYASISYLQSLPISIIKIDRSFVSGNALADSEREAFLHAIVGLAKSLNLRSVAEGIEDAQQLEQLRAIGCDVGQGYHWSPAVPFVNTIARIGEIESAHAAGDSKTGNSVGLSAGFGPSS